jgi:hypothetical protein
MAGSHRDSVHCVLVALSPQWVGVGLCVKQLGCNSCHSPPSGAEKERIYTSTPPCFHGLRRRTFISQFYMNFNLRSLETNHRLWVWVCVRACVSAFIFCTRHKLLFLQAGARSLSYWKTWEVPCSSLRESTVCLWPRPLSFTHSRLKSAEVMSWHICDHHLTHFWRKGSLFNKCKKSILYYNTFFKDRLYPNYN